MSEATLTVSCPDRKGLVAALSTLLYDHGANILQSQQHVDRAESRFFERIQFDLTDLDIPREQLEDLLRIECGRYDMEWQIRYRDQRCRVALFVSKIEHCFWDLLIRHRLGELPCDIVLAISNHPDLEPVAKQFGVPYHVFPITRETKRSQEDAECALLEENEIDLVVMARYMQILSDEFISRYPQRIINIHHSFLPAFVGAKPYHQAKERGVKIIGATAHYVTADLDQGPIIDQDVCRVTHRDSARDLIRKGRDLERQVLGRAVRLHLHHQVVVHENRTLILV